jgi:hypothetical protein
MRVLRSHAVAYEHIYQLDLCVTSQVRDYRLVTSCERSPSVIFSLDFSDMQGTSRHAANLQTLPDPEAKYFHETEK